MGNDLAKEFLLQPERAMCPKGIRKVNFSAPLAFVQGFHKLFAYGCPDKGREFDKRTDKELLKRLYNVYN